MSASNTESPQEQVRKIFPMSSVDPADTRMELTCGTTRMVILYLQDKYGQKAVEDFVYETRMNLDYISSLQNWMSLNYYFRFLDTLVEFTGNENAPFEAGTYGGKQKCMGWISLLAGRFATTSSTYRLMVQLAPRWNKVAEWKLLTCKRDHCRISVRNFSIPQQKHNCRAIQGVVAAVPQLHDLPLATITEQQCACEGAEACVYDVKWINSPARIWAWVGLLAGLAVGLICTRYAWWRTNANLIAVPIGLLGYLAGRHFDYRSRLRRVYSQNEQQASTVMESVHEIEKLNEGLQRTVEERTDELKQANSTLQKTLAELEESQARVVEAERQATVGIMAGGMAHELNNPIAAIRLATQTLREQVPDDPGSKVFMDAIDRGTSRCVRIIRDLLAYARSPNKSNLTSIDEVISDTIALVADEHPGSAEIRKTIAPGIPPVVLDAPQIKQVLLNLISNAIEATNGTGVVEITASSVNDKMIIEVADDGPGIPAENQSLVFKPFFTTKKGFKKGLGLGLSIVSEIVERHGGSISVSSVPGAGTAFTVTFTMVRAEHGPPFLGGGNDDHV